MHTIRDQYDLITKSEKIVSDFQAMLCWLSLCKVSASDNEFFGSGINAVLVNAWIEYRNSLNNSGRYERKYLLECALESCDAWDKHELENNDDLFSDGDLMALGRIFVDCPAIDNALKPKPVTEINVCWLIDDVQNVRPDLTDEQAGEVLSLADRAHDATVGINWEVLEMHAEKLYPEPN